MTFKSLTWPLVILASLLAFSCTTKRDASPVQKEASSRPNSGHSARGDADTAQLPDAKVAIEMESTLSDATHAASDAGVTIDAAGYALPDASPAVDTTAPRLTHDLVDLSATYDAAAQTLGALRCAGDDAGVASGCFTAFRSTAAPAAGFVDPGYLGLSTALNATVYSTSAGAVMEIRELETGEYQLLIRASDTSVFGVEYRHLRNLQVRVGDTVSAGATLGLAGTLDGMRGRVGLSVRRDQTVTQRLCPERYGDVTWVAHLSSAREAHNIAAPAQVWAAACDSDALLCATSPCDTPDRFTASLGDIEYGRTIYARDCASCHGNSAEGVSASNLLSCTYCVSPTVMANRIALDMPPEGQCKGTCANDTAAFVFFEWR